MLKILILPPNFPRMWVFQRPILHFWTKRYRQEEKYSTVRNLAGWQLPFASLPQRHWQLYTVRCREASVCVGSEWRRCSSSSSSSSCVAGIPHAASEAGMQRLAAWTLQYRLQHWRHSALFSLDLPCCWDYRQTDRETESVHRTRSRPKHSSSVVHHVTSHTVSIYI